MRGKESVKFILMLLIRQKRFLFCLFYFFYMTDSYRNRICETEKKYLPLLFEYCRSLFKNNLLPSHDHLHHYRVWQYAKDLLAGLSDEGRELSIRDISLLMLAVFFHDTGLTKTLDENHGLESRRICEEFLICNPDVFAFHVDVALKAIEMHDKKQMNMEKNDDCGVDLLKILSICDDTDAFGSIGILRYAEIYILRGIPVKTLANKVLTNMDYRIGFLLSQKWIPESYLKKHTERFRYAYDFYEKLKLPDFGHSSQNYRKILECYMGEVYTGESDLMQFASNLAKSDYPETAKFGTLLISDLQDNSLNCR